MSADLPSPWAQAYPRSVRLAPDGLLVPAATPRLQLARDGLAIFTAYLIRDLVSWIEALLPGSRAAGRAASSAIGARAACATAGFVRIERALASHFVASEFVLLG
jgi:hypothetical protein